jgi:hypothetical protein
VVNPVVKTDENPTPSLSVTPVVTRTWYVVALTSGPADNTEYVIESVELGAADIWTQVAKISDDNCNVPLQVVSAVLTVRDAGVVERLRAATTVREMATQKHATPGQIALAWLLHKGDDIVPIPGTKRRNYLEENAGAASVMLSAGKMQQLDEALRPETVAGPLYSPQYQAFIDR